MNRILLSTSMHLLPLTLRPTSFLAPWQFRRIHVLVTPVSPTNGSLEECIRKLVILPNLKTFPRNVRHFAFH